MPGDKKGFKLFEDKTIPYLQAPGLCEDGFVEHAFSSRRGGLSEGPFSSLNTGFHTGDQFEHVLENRNRFFKQFAYDYRAIVSSIQVHGTGIGVFSGINRGEGALPKTALKQCDALITEEPGLPLAAYSADCLLIFYAARKRPLVALAHAGWRGTLENISGTVVGYLKQYYGVNPDELTAALSPFICRQCYRIDEELAGSFKFAGWNHSAYLSPLVNEDGEYQLDLQAINTTQLIRSGVEKNNIFYSDWCTSCNPDLFYSYRRDSGLTGRMLGFIAIKNN